MRASTGAGPNITLPIFQGGQLRYTLDLRKAQEQEAAINYTRTVLQAWHDVDNALTAYEREQQRRAELIRAVAQNRACAFTRAGTLPGRRGGLPVRSDGRAAGVINAGATGDEHDHRFDQSGGALQSARVADGSPSTPCRQATSKLIPNTRFRSRTAFSAITPADARCVPCKSGGSEGGRTRREDWESRAGRNPS